MQPVKASHRKKGVGEGAQAAAGLPLGTTRRRQAPAGAQLVFPTP